MADSPIRTLDGVCPSAAAAARASSLAEGSGGSCPAFSSYTLRSMLPKGAGPPLVALALSAIVGDALTARAANRVGAGERRSRSAMIWTVLDFVFVTLRQDPRYDDLIRAVGLPRTH